MNNKPTKAEWQAMLKAINKMVAESKLKLTTVDGKPGVRLVKQPSATKDNDNEQHHRLDMLLCHGSIRTRSNNHVQCSRGYCWVRCTFNHRGMVMTQNNEWHDWPCDPGTDYNPRHVPTTIKPAIIMDWAVDIVYTDMDNMIANDQYWFAKTWFKYQVN